ncbi:MAG: ATP-binding protein [Pseudomonadota bacterium]
MTQHRFSKLSKLTTRLAFLSFCLIFFIHLLLFLYYINVNKRAKSQINHDIVVQQVMNLIERIRYTPAASQAKIIKAVDVPNLNLSITKKPSWHLDFKSNATLWEISQGIRNQHQLIKLSLALVDKSWLNISAQVEKNSLWSQMILLILEFFIIIILTLSMLSINRFATPLVELKKAAERLGVDVNSPPVTIYGPTIVKETAHAMNKMQERIRDLLSERTRMLGALSHDLRTPITRMKLRTQFIDDKEIASKNTQDLEEMEAMITETLNFVKQNFKVRQAKRFELYSLLLSICNSFSDIGKHISFAAKQYKIVLLGHPVALRRALNNIIENALKYAGTAAVKLQVENNQVRIIVADNGPGIPEKQLQKVFSPFYRAENSRSRQTGGVGLGLAIARDVIKAHKGTIEVKNTNPGLQVIITMPLAVKC